MREMLDRMSEHETKLRVLIESCEGACKDLEDFQVSSGPFLPE